jgi:hypothetical protein
MTQPAAITQRDWRSRVQASLPILQAWFRRLCSVLSPRTSAYVRLASGAEGFLHWPRSLTATGRT